MRALAVVSLLVLASVPVKALSLGAAWAKASADTDADRALRGARRASDRAYRLTNDLQMMSRTVAEARTEAASLPARRERLEFLLKFLGDAYPVQGDAAAYVLDTVVWLKYELGKPANPEFPAALKELVARVKASDDATQALKADVDALKAAVAAAPESGEKAIWLAERLAAYAAQQAEYSKHIRERAAVLEKPAA